MFIKKHFIHNYCLPFMVALILLSACSLTTAAKGIPVGIPDSLQIKIDIITPDNNKAVTLSNSILIQQLYQIVYTLPQMPNDIACTKELGPHYTLIFRQNGKTMGTVLAKKEGCRPITISGERRDRQAVAAFWTLLDQAIANGSPSNTNSLRF